MSSRVPAAFRPVPLDYQIFDPADCAFPAARIPPLPDGLAGLSLGTQADRGGKPPESFRHFVRARYALLEAYRLSGIGRDGALLAPAYHCRTMIDPALVLGGPVLLYPVRPDLSTDIGELDRLLQHSPVPVRALLATHFFGLPQALAPIAAWCTERGITLVEDCSHALFMEHGQAPNVGNVGDFVVSSPYKFIPCPDGGLLHARQAGRLDGLHPRPQPLKAELRGIDYALSMARKRRHGPACAIDAIDADLAALPRRPMGDDSRRQDGLSADYRPTEEGLASLRFSRFLCRHADLAGIAHRRRRHYARWAEATSEITGCRPLAPLLPNGCVPYMFPLHIDRPEHHFHPLKHLGVPIWRWDSIAASDCPTAGDYRLHLLHLPCHQAVTEPQLDWMIAAVRRVLRGTPGSTG